MRFKKKLNSRIISSILAASMVLSSIPVVAFADTDVQETEPDVIIDYVVTETETPSETTAVVETSETVEESDDNVTSIPEDEESSEDEFAEDIVEPPIDETVATEETPETVEEVDGETEVIEETTVNIISVTNADEFILAVVNLSDNNRIVVNTYEDITDSIVNASGVYFDGTYVISFSDSASLNNAIEYLNGIGITYAIEGTVSLCDTGVVTISNAEINPNATTRVAVIDTGSNVANESYSVISDSVSDDNGHGTRMVNYILDNTSDAYIISIKAIGSDGTGSVSDLCSAIEFAMDSDVDIIVMALSVRNNGEYEALEELISEANSRGIKIIASAGNNNSDASNYLPASCSGVITVGAVTSEGYKYSSSNYGTCVNYYVEATSTSEACSTFAGLYIAGNTNNVRTDYVPYIVDESEPVEVVEIEENHVIVDGQGEWNFWQISNGITEADIRNAGYGSSDAFRTAITASANHMTGANYSQSGGNGVNGEKVDCITYVNVAYAEALHVISNVHQTNGYVYFNGSAAGSPYGLYTTTGATGCQYWLGNHGITGNGVSINTSLHVEQGDLVFFGTYTEETETTYTCTLKYQAGSAGSSGITYGREQTVTGTGSTQTAAYNNAKGKMTGGGTGGYKINSTTYSSSTRVISTSMNWGHAAIYSGSGTDFWQARGSAYTAGRSSRSVSINAESTGYNRWLVIHLPTFKSTGHISLEKIVAPGYENVVNGNPCYSLAGTVYTLYSDAACTNALRTFTFDANGHCGTQFDISEFNTTYYLKETTAGTGYLIDSITYKLTLGSSVEDALTVTNMSSNQSFTVFAVGEVYKITVSDTPGLDPLNISVAKENGTFDTTAPLDGARFRLDYYQTTGAVSGNPDVSYEFALADIVNYTVITDGSVSGDITLSFLAGLTPTSGENYFKTVNDALTSMGLSTRDFPIGTYRITEITAPVGYSLNNQTNQFVIHINNNHTDVEVTASTLGAPDYRGTVTHELLDNHLKVTFHETPEVGYAALKKTLNVDEEIVGRYTFTCYNTTDGTLIARGTTLDDGTVSWVYVAANYCSVEVNVNGTYKVLTGTTTTELELPVYNANHEKIVYEFRETIPTNHDYEGTGVVFTYDCPVDWNQGNGYFYKTFTVNPGTPSAKDTKIVECPNRLKYGSLVILKSISDGEGLTTDQTFTFNVYYVGEDGNTTLIKENISITIPAGQTSGTSEVITQVPLGTYRVVENTNSRYSVTYERQEVTVTDYTVHPDPFVFSVNNHLIPPSIGTTFTYENSHVAPMNSTVTLVDTVEYEGLEPNTRYQMEGYIVIVNDDGTTSMYLDEMGDPVINGVSFTTGDSNSEDGTVSGTERVEFVVDTTNLAGKKLVAFESLYYEDIRLAVHMDINSESQTIRVPNIHTTATVNGGKVFDATSDITLVDVISFENLEVGREYYVYGILMDKSTNQPLGVGECCADVIATTTFTPTASSGTVTVEFRFNGSALIGGQELVVFEEIYDVETNTKIAEHKDISDQGQTVKVKPTTTPTPTPSTTTPTPGIPSTGEEASIASFAGTILFVIGALGITVMLLRKRVKEGNGNSDKV